MAWDGQSTAIMRFRAAAEGSAALLQNGQRQTRRRPNVARSVCTRQCLQSAFRQQRRARACRPQPGKAQRLRFRPALRARALANLERRAPARCLPACILGTRAGATSQLFYGGAGHASAPSDAPYHTSGGMRRRLRSCREWKRSCSYVRTDTKSWANPGGLCRLDSTLVVATPYGGHAAINSSAPVAARERC